MNRMSYAERVIAVSALVLLMMGTVEAEFIGLNINPNHLASSTSNTFNNDSIDFTDDLDVDDPAQTPMIFVLEHPVSALPNIRYQGSQLSSDSNPNNQYLSSGNHGSSTFDISNEDFVLYYQLFDDGIDLDLGLDVKQVDGEVSFDGTPGNTVVVDETIPLLYLSARFDLPLDGFYVGADLNASVIDLGLSESTAQDSTILLGYESGTGLGLEGGYKHFSLDLDNVDAPDTDLEYDGVFLNGYVNF